MKRALTVAGIAAAALAVLAAAGVLLYRHFVAGRIMDGGDMTNPFQTQEAVSPLLPDGAAFISLSWLQNAMSYEDCYRFDLCGGPDAPEMECSFGASGSGGQRLELGGDDWSAERLPTPISRERWEQVERLLRETSAPAYEPADADLSDAQTNRMSVVWREANGTEHSASFDGTDAAPLLALLQEIAREAAAADQRA